ncbi:hypothetical protein AWC15_21625 [Mycobacterium lacus]|nr:hypothetical protein AWC15_21625 [Mycobacterium lacus]
MDTMGASDAFVVGLLDMLWEPGILGGRADPHRIELGMLPSAPAAASLSSAPTVTRAGADPPDRTVLLDQSGWPP